MIVRAEVAFPLIAVGAKLAVAPVGKPVMVSAMVPPKPFSGVLEMV